MQSRQTVQHSCTTAIQLFFLPQLHLTNRETESISSLKRGFLEACVLAAVSGEESYGYQIVKDVPASMGLTESTLYPLLKRLEKAGCITARSAEHNGRLRRYYRITETGHERIAEFLAEWPSVQEIYRYVKGAHHDAR